MVVIIRLIVQVCSFIPLRAEIDVIITLKFYIFIYKFFKSIVLNIFLECCDSKFKICRCLVDLVLISVLQRCYSYLILSVKSIPGIRCILKVCIILDYFIRYRDLIYQLPVIQLYCIVCLVQRCLCGFKLSLASLIGGNVVFGCLKSFLKSLPGSFAVILC